MRITSVKPRRDGKFLVGLLFNTGRLLRKVVTAEALEGFRKAVEVERQQTEGYMRREEERRARGECDRARIAEIETQQQDEGPRNAREVTVRGAVLALNERMAAEMEEAERGMMRADWEGNRVD